MSSTNSNIHEILKDPSAAYGSPRDVADDASLSLEEKKNILRCWEEDMEALLRAEEENMPPPEKNGTAGDKLTLISKLRRQLKKH